MTETFNVGDEVIPTTRGGARATVEYGPYVGIATEDTAYLVKMIDGADAGKCVNILPSALKRPAKFKVGDKVRSKYGATKYTVEGGPFFGHSEWYALKEDDGKVYVGGVESLEAEPAEIKIGDRVRVVTDDPDYQAGEFVGLVGTVTRTRGESSTPFTVQFGDGEHGARDGYWHCAEVEKVDEPADTFKYEGVTYDLSDRYRDRDGDVWNFRRVDDVVRGEMSGGTPNEDSYSLIYAARTYGPLRKI